MPRGDRRPTPLFDIKTARKRGVAPVRKGGRVVKHGGSRDPVTGKILKAQRHPTFNKAIAADAKLGFKPFRNKKTRAIHTFKRNPDRNKFTPLDVDKLLKRKRPNGVVNT